MESNQELISLIDGDIIAYSVGFAAKDEPLSYALHSAKKMVENIQEASGGTERQVFLTGSNNFRKEVATLQEYKGNRKQPKPPHHAEIRDYLVSAQDAIVVDDYEADDALGIIQYNPPEGKDTIICTIDKDLDMIAGKHYCWRGKREGLYGVSQVEADRFFYTQLLTGDSGDNIPGLYKYTSAKATTKVKKPLEYMTDPIEMYEYVRGVYHRNASYGTNFPIEPDDFIEEIGKLLWIQRQPNQMWTSPLLDESSGS